METVRNGRTPQGRFAPGATAGPGRPRKGMRSPAAERLFTDLQTILLAHLQAEVPASIEDVIGAAELLLMRARQVRPHYSRGRRRGRGASPPAGSPTLRGNLVKT